MEGIKKELRETLGVMIHEKKAVGKFNVRFNGVLIYGAAGVGKSFIVQATAGEYGLNLIDLKISDMTSSYYGGSVKKIDDAFKTAIKKAPCLLFLDEIDSVGAKRGKAGPIMEDTRITNHLLHWFEEIRDRKARVYIFAATNSKEDLDEALIRSGRFDKHIYIPLPDREARQAILKACLKARPVDPDIDVLDAAMRTEGMNAANIDAIVNKAALNAITRSVGMDGSARIGREDLLGAVRTFRHRRKDGVKALSWNDVILNPEIKAELERLVKIIENPELTLGLGIQPPKGILLYGPPGTGKTTIAKVIANESNASFLTISQADIYSKWVGESQQNVRKIFMEARSVRPAIVFIDEIDSILSHRGGREGGSFYTDQVASLILQEIDGMEDSAGVFILGATNVPDAVEPALLRGGRMSIQIEVPLPEAGERKKMFATFLSRVSGAQDLDMAALTEMTHGYSGADIREICSRAILDSLNGGGPQQRVLMTQDKLVSAVKNYKKTSSIYRVPPNFRRATIGFHVAEKV
jgi:transitional endoplasmic reticulum ATPase